MFPILAVSAMLSTCSSSCVCLETGALEKSKAKQDVAREMWQGLQNAYRRLGPNAADWLARSNETIDNAMLRLKLNESKQEISDLRQKVERLDKSPRH